MISLHGDPKAYEKTIWEAARAVRKYLKRLKSKQRNSNG